MSRQQRGFDYEHELAKAVFDVSDGRVIPIRCGYSGNQALPSPDILIAFDGTLRAHEIKTTSRDKLTVTPDDIEDIGYWATQMTEIPTYPYLGVKFSYWQLYVGRLYRVSSPEIALERWAENAPFGAYVTDGGNLKVPKPDSDVWNSSKSVDSDTPDADHLIEVMEQETEEPSVTEIVRQLDGFKFQRLP